MRDYKFLLKSVSAGILVTIKNETLKGVSYLNVA